MGTFKSIQKFGRIELEDSQNTRILDQFMDDVTRSLDLLNDDINTVGSGDDTVKVSAADDAVGFLSEKLIDSVDGAITFTIITPGGDEDFRPALDQSKISHLNIGDIGINSHAVIDSHIANAAIHFTEGSIDHGSIGGLGDDDHPALLPRDGSRPMTGEFDLDGFPLIFDADADTQLATLSDDVLQWTLGSVSFMRMLIGDLQMLGTDITGIGDLQVVGISTFLSELLIGQNFLQLEEMTPPGTPAADKIRLYADVDNAISFLQQKDQLGVVTSLIHGHSSVQLTADQSNTIAFDPFATGSTIINGTERNITFSSFSGNMILDIGGKFEISAALVLSHSAGADVEIKIKKGGSDFLKQASFIGTRKVTVPIEVQSNGANGDTFEIEVRPSSGTVTVREGSVFNINRVGDI